MSARPTRHRRGRIAAIAAIALAGFAIFFYGALNSPVLDPTLAARKIYLDRIIRSSALDPAKERALAEAYWSRYPDVAVDSYFGRHGKLGIEGAREHFERHGKAEERAWGVGK
jgi:hypothetical protein